MVGVLGPNPSVDTKKAAKRQPLFVQRANTLFLFHWVASQSAAQFLENLPVHLAQHYCRVYLTVAQLRQLLQSLAAVLVIVREHAQRHQYFVGMQAWVLGTKILRLRLLHRLDKAL